MNVGRKDLGQQINMVFVMFSPLNLPKVSRYIQTSGTT